MYLRLMGKDEDVKLTDAWIDVMVKPYGYSRLCPIEPHPKGGYVVHVGGDEHVDLQGLAEEFDSQGIMAVL